MSCVTPCRQIEFPILLAYSMIRFCVGKAGKQRIHMGIFVFIFFLLPLLVFCFCYSFVFLCYSRLFGYSFKHSSAKAIDLLHFVCQKLIELMTSAIDLCGTQMSATDWGPSNKSMCPMWLSPCAKANATKKTAQQKD